MANVVDDLILERSVLLPGRAKFRPKRLEFDRRGGFESAGTRDEILAQSHEFRFEAVCLLPVRGQHQVALGADDLNQFLGQAQRFDHPLGRPLQHAVKPRVQRREVGDPKPGCHARQDDDGGERQP